MKSLFKISLLLAFIIAFCSGTMIPSRAETSISDNNNITVSLPNIFPIAYHDPNNSPAGIYVELINEMDRIYSTQGVTINGKRVKGRIMVKGVYPFIRSLKNVQYGKADLHVPYISSPYCPESYLMEEMGIRYSTAIFSYANFTLYTSKEMTKGIGALEKKAGKKLNDFSSEKDFKLFDAFLAKNNYIIEVDSAHNHFFPFKMTPSIHAVNSLKKLSLHRIDGYIHNEPECDKEIREQKIDRSNIRKLDFFHFTSRFIIRTGDQGSRTDEIVSRLVWALQGRGVEDVSLSTLPWSEYPKEVPRNSYHKSQKFLTSKWYRISKETWDPAFSQEFE